MSQDEYFEDATEDTRTEETTHGLEERQPAQDAEKSADHASRRSERDTGRVESFSDGIFAFAITLLVLNLLNLRLPDVAAVDADILARALRGAWPVYTTFLLSFSTILIMWVYHHRLFQVLERAETSLLFSNGFLLLLVTAVPFPTALVGTYLLTPAAPVACAVYAGFFAMIDLAYNLLWLVVARQHSGTFSPRLPRGMFFTLLGFPCYLLALVVAFWQPFVTLAICGALWIVWALTAPTQQTR